MVDLMSACLAILTPQKSKSRCSNVCMFAIFWFKPHLDIMCLVSFDPVWAAGLVLRSVMGERMRGENCCWHQLDPHNLAIV